MIFDVSDSKDNYPYRVDARLLVSHAKQGARLMSDSDPENSGHWLLKLKTSPPPSNQWHVLREDALRKLGNGRDLKLALVNAPAGYGKTTFLSQAYQNAVREQITTIWVTLDETDETPAGFVANLKAAVDLTFAPDADSEIPRGTQVSLNLRSKMDLILGQLAQQDAPILIFFDEGDHLKQSKTIQALSYFIQKAPSNLTFAIASRGVLPLKTAEYRATNRLCQITAMDLRFNDREISTFLADVLPDGFPLDFVIQTEGWPLALQMVKLWLQEHPSRIHSARDIPINLMDIANYLAEQIYADLSPVLQNFLAMTSILDRFTGDVANAVCLRSDGWTLIEQLMKANCFIIPLDSEGQWYRYHPLFVTFLRNRLRLRHHIDVGKLHARASEWFVSTRQWGLAVRHAVASEDYERAADIIEMAGGWKLVPTSSISVVEEALQHMPDNLVRRRPRLSLAKAFLLAKHGQVKEALTYTSKPEIPVSEVAGHDPETIENQIVLLLLGGYSDDYLKASQRPHVLNISHDIETTDEVARASLSNCLCLFHLDHRDFDLAEQQALITIDQLGKAGMEDAFGYLYCQLAQIGIARGDFSRVDHYQTLVVGDHDQEWQFDNNATVFISIYAAEVAVERNDMVLAEKLLGQSFPYATDIDGWFDILAAGFATAARIAYDGGGIAPGARCSGQSRCRRHLTRSFSPQGNCRGNAAFTCLTRRRRGSSDALLRSTPRPDREAEDVPGMGKDLAIGRDHHLCRKLLFSAPSQL